LAQAKAQLKMARAARDPVELTYKRYQNLFKGKVISAQDFDTAADIYGGNQGVVTAEQDNVDRLEALQERRRTKLRKYEISDGHALKCGFAQRPHSQAEAAHQKRLARNSP
jgi:multidrug resistance efflux pump